jgi:hypothetical protein
MWLRRTLGLPRQYATERPLPAKLNVCSGSKRQSDPLDTGRSHATSLRYAVLNFIVSGKQMEQIEPGLFATLKQDAVIPRSTRAFYRKGSSSQLYCHELIKAGRFGRL